MFEMKIYYVLNYYCSCNFNNRRLDDKCIDNVRVNRNEHITMLKKMNMLVFGKLTLGEIMLIGCVLKYMFTKCRKDKVTQ